MGSYTPQQFIVRLLQMNVGVGRVPLEGVSGGAQLVKDSILQMTPVSLSGDHNAALSVKVQISGWSGTGSQAAISAVGPWQLIERNTRAHSEPRERQRGGPKRYVAFSGQVYSHVEHPGTRGKHTFQKGSDRALPAVNRLFGIGVSTAVARSFIG